MLISTATQLSLKAPKRNCMLIGNIELSPRREGLEEESARYNGSSGTDQSKSGWRHPYPLGWGFFKSIRTLRFSNMRKPRPNPVDLLYWGETTESFQPL